MWAALSPPQFLTPEEAQALPLPPLQCPLLLAATAPARVVAVALQPPPLPPLVLQPLHPLTTTTTTTLLLIPALKNVASGWMTGRVKINPFSG